MVKEELELARLWGEDSEEGQALLALARRETAAYLPRQSAETTPRAEGGAPAATLIGLSAAVAVGAGIVLVVSLSLLRTSSSASLSASQIALLPACGRSTNRAWTSTARGIGSPPPPHRRLILRTR